MTDQTPSPHVTALEAAARIYCQRAGQDPDAQISVPHPVIANYAVQIPFWHTVADGMFDLQMMLSAMKAAAKDAEPKIEIAR